MFRFAAAILVVFNISCAKNADDSRKGIDPQPEVAAPALIEDSLTVQPLSVPASALEDKAHLTIRKSSLEKEFLLQTSMITVAGAPRFRGMKSRVIAFRWRGDKVYLVEATKGHTVTKDLPQTLILAEFNILNQAEETLTVDFNKGMSQLFVATDWRAQDLDGGAYGNEFVAVEARSSYIEEAKTVNNTVVLRQIAQLKLPNVGAQANLHLQAVEVKYYLSPYNPDQTYKPVRSKDFLRTGFFEGAPLANVDGADLVYATRFNPANPITYAVSANTPAEFKDAVREGVLYWNQAFGKEVVKAIDAPAGVVAPDSAYNVVQWIAYDAAGGAYADAQIDPRSGEILHAQVWMSSAFGFLGKWRAHELYRRLKPQAPKAPTISLAGFQTEGM
ncbi:MAG: hypothetical protein ABL958_14155, partial [Bdellovibrionia bacterium]